MNFKSRILSILCSIVFPPRGHEPKLSVQMKTIELLVDFFKSNDCPSAENKRLQDELVRFLGKNVKNHALLISFENTPDALSLTRHLFEVFVHHPRLLQIAFYFILLLYRSCDSADFRADFESIFKESWSACMNNWKNHDIAYLSFFALWSDKLPITVCSLVFSLEFMEKVQFSRPFVRARILEWLIDICRKVNVFFL